MKYGLGYTFVEELQKQHHDLEKFVAAFHKGRTELEETNSYGYDRFIEQSSNATGNVGDSKDKLDKKYIWGTNHYLGLNRHPEVIKATVEAVLEYGTGSGTSAISGGRCKLHFEIEEFLKEFLNKKGVVLYPTGYTTNLGLLSTIVQKNDVVISDSENHASMIDGVKLSRKSKMVFKHNCLEDLEAKLQEAQGKFQNIFVAIESAYSMSGEFAPLKEIVALKKKYNFYLYLDEAHTFGIYGENGEGLAAELGVLDEVDFLTGTFSKSCASIGGFAVFGETMRTFITSKSTSYLFQATFPPAAAATILATLKLFSTDKSLAKDLHEKNAYMRKQFTDRGFNLGESVSPIIPIFIPDVEKLMKIEREMYERGVFAVSVIYPAVRPDEGRIRLIVNKAHTYEDIDATVEILHQLAVKYDIL